MVVTFKDSVVDVELDGTTCCRLLPFVSFCSLELELDGKVNTFFTPSTRSSWTLDVVEVEVEEVEVALDDDDDDGGVVVGVVK